jgi:hypothetical protein
VFDKDMDLWDQDSRLRVASGPGTQSNTNRLSLVVYSQEAHDPTSTPFPTASIIELLKFERNLMFENFPVPFIHEGTQY